MEPQEIQLLEQFYWVIIIIGLWTLPWKGVALWKAAKNNQKAWFIAILLLNTLAIVEILYIFLFSKKPKKDLDVLDTNIKL